MASLSPLINRAGIASPGVSRRQRGTAGTGGSLDGHAASRDTRHPAQPVTAGRPPRDRGTARVPGQAMPVSAFPGARLTRRASRLPAAAVNLPAGRLRTLGKGNREREVVIFEGRLPVLHSTPYTRRLAFPPRGRPADDRAGPFSRAPSRPSWTGGCRPSSCLSPW